MARADDSPRDAPQPRRRLHRLRRALRARRERIRANPTLNTTYRVGLGAFGTLVLIVGIIAIPYPGPGWLIVFAGLGILATEFHWAHQVNVFTKRHYRRWSNWVSRQHWTVKLGIAALTGIVVVLTLWLLGMYATIGRWFGVDWPWLTSPLLGP
ncbi:MULTISPECIES: TIGR02611 family protein [Saccharopolyspora]|uniref:TIGR02611 family protein n=1 Tax=Saccharopolyspora gregorii TaxID=33914 RepID=A0ABP6RT53_9PSEU|nr:MULTISPECIES: TIGR02611 family protein [Saccharopolyspora]MCA1187083.1 TIGR02611 family protein [Saccharopolyspora sp. 6T]MCA1192784.1 TIGR02611 family protein [Saccharopolyspora sp. 6V]MCA1225399.1 TIGR02611 family protein [Saccharopolyspora sp. 6M]